MEQIRVPWNEKQYWYDIFYSFISILLKNIFILIFKIMK